MLNFSTVETLQKHLKSLKQQGKSIGFVPTMGALHPGHLALIKRAKNETDVVVCSIFVNPTQFNNKEDLLKYPRTIAEDSKLLKEIGCDVVFIPSEEEVYPKDANFKKHDFGTLEQVMEGAFRPGHFNGVATVVKRLFEIVNPDKAYFGLKDYQQLAIIKAMVKQEGLNLEIISCDIVREVDGLAMSSRNTRLNNIDRQRAVEISKALFKSKELANDTEVASLISFVKDQLNKEYFKLEYFEIVHPETLQLIKNWKDVEYAVGCVAVWIGGVRLIDNIVYNV